MEVVRVEGLPDAPLDAAAEFHRVWLPRIMAQVDPSRSGEDLLLVFPLADHRHRLWRLAAVQELARAAVPHRVNAVAADSDAAIASALTYLRTAPGVTGQYWPLDVTGAEGA